MRLSEVPVNMHTCSELLRLSLRTTDEEDTSDDDHSSSNSELKDHNDVDVVKICSTTYRQLRTKRALLQFKDVLLRTRRGLLLYKVYGISALLVLNGTFLICNNALLALN